MTDPVKEFKPVAISDLVKHAEEELVKSLEAAGVGEDDRKKRAAAAKEILQSTMKDTLTGAAGQFLFGEDDDTKTKAYATALKLATAIDAEIKGDKEKWKGEIEVSIDDGKGSQFQQRDELKVAVLMETAIVTQERFNTEKAAIKTIADKFGDTQDVDDVLSAMNKDAKKSAALKMSLAELEEAAAEIAFLKQYQKQYGESAKKVTDPMKVEAKDLAAKIKDAIDEEARIAKIAALHAVDSTMPAVSDQEKADLKTQIEAVNKAYNDAKTTTYKDKKDDLEAFKTLVHKNLDTLKAADPEFDKTWVARKSEIAKNKDTKLESDITGMLDGNNMEQKTGVNPNNVGSFKSKGEGFKIAPWALATTAVAAAGLSFSSNPTPAETDDKGKVTKEEGSSLQRWAFGTIAAVALVATVGAYRGANLAPGLAVHKQIWAGLGGGVGR